MLTGSWWTSISMTETSKRSCDDDQYITYCQAACAPLLLEDPLLPLPLCRGGGDWCQQSSPHGNNNNQSPHLTPHTSPHLTPHLTAIESTSGLRDLPGTGGPPCPGRSPPSRGSVQGIYLGMQVELRLELSSYQLSNTIQCLELKIWPLQYRMSPNCQAWTSLCDPTDDTFLSYRAILLPHGNK